MTDEPTWYAKVRKLAARGKSKREIAVLVEKSDRAVRNVLSPEAREAMRAYGRRYYRKHKREIIVATVTNRQRRLKSRTRDNGAD